MINILTESELLNLLRINLIPDLMKTEEFDPIDFYSKNLDLWFEAKCRKTHYPTLLLQKDKYVELKKKKRSRYIVSTPQGVFSLNINKLEEEDITWEKKWMPSSSEYYRTTDYTLRDVTFVDINKFKDITNLLYE